MTVRERVLASQLIQKVDSNSGYAKKIGVIYTFSKIEADKTQIKVGENDSQTTIGGN